MRRLCFYTCLSFCPQGGGIYAQSQGGGVGGLAGGVQTQAWKWGCLYPGLGNISQHALMQNPQQKATAADGTHPTGMHSCVNLILFESLKINLFEMQKYHIIPLIIILKK